ncbi:MAG: hypothetical protein ABI665_12465 [Vicinamibacterales bacterium]
MRRIVCTAILVLVAATNLSAAEVLLKNSWLSKFKNRVTMDLTYRLDKAHKKPNAIGEKSEDGDMHLAGRSTQVGLPFVVEIVNAALPALAGVLQSVKDLTGQADTISIAGAWRLWFEHPASTAQHQGSPVGVPASTNPSHVFEIHPVTRWGTDNLDESFVPVPGFTAHDAATAFGRYEKMIVTVTKGASFTSFEAKTIGYNYTEFTIVLTSVAKKVDDGYMALARVAGLDGTMLVNSPRRMVFAEGTKPAALIATAKAGAKFRTLAIPRLNLERLMEKAKNGESIDVQGAYEMIVVGLTKQ